MNPRSYLVDTNILVNVIRRKKDRSELLRKIIESGGSLSVSVITIGELYAGMKPPEKERTDALLDGFDQFAVTSDIARYAGLLNDHRLKGGGLGCD